MFLERCCGRMLSDVAGSSADSLPALLLIHGDSYSWGAGNSFDGTALAAHGRLIVVSINFRLGVLGKLAILIHWNKLSQFSTISEHELRPANVCGYFIRLFAVARIYYDRLRKDRTECIWKNRCYFILSENEIFFSYPLLKKFIIKMKYIRSDFNLNAFHLCNKSQN